MKTEEVIEEFVTIKDAANRTGYAVSTLYTYICKKIIPAQKLGRRVYVLLSDLYKRMVVKYKKRKKVNLEFNF